MTEQQGEYNLDKIRREHAALQKYAAIQKAAEDKIGVQKIYIDITGDWEAALVLDEIIFFTLPRDGKISGLRVWKDGVLWMAVQRAEWWERKRLNPRQADTAIKKLEDQDLVIKKIFKFNGQTTTHLRLNISKFFERYMEELEKQNPPEDQTNTITKDLKDLYEMMGEPAELQNGDSQNGETESPKCETESPNGNSINTPHTSDTQPSRDLLSMAIEMANFPGAKKQVRIDAILGKIGTRLNVNSETKRWKEFAKFAEERQRLHGETIDQFLIWLTSQPGFDLQYWSQQRMMEHWPRAFVENPNQPAIDTHAVEQTRRMLDEKEKEYVPMPDGLRPKINQVVSKLSVR